jgi:hypothetical protein
MAAITVRTYGSSSTIKIRSDAMLFPREIGYSPDY